MKPIYEGDSIEFDVVAESEQSRRAAVLRVVEIIRRSWPECVVEKQGRENVAIVYSSEAMQNDWYKRGLRTDNRHGMIMVSYHIGYKLTVTVSYKDNAEICAILASIREGLREPIISKGYEQHISYCTCSFEFRQENGPSEHEDGCRCK